MDEGSGWVVIKRRSDAVQLWKLKEALGTDSSEVRVKWQIRYQLREHGLHLMRRLGHHLMSENDSMQEFLTHYTECTKNPSLFWNIIVFLIFGAESFQKRDVKHSSCKSLKTINALILLKEFQGKCKQTREILSAGISDYRIMQLVEEMFDTGNRKLFESKWCYSACSP